MKILISSNPENLKQAIAGKRSVTIEAEYGDSLVKGSVATLAHHGPRKGNPCPCSIGPFPENANIEVIGISHIDLDTIGGIMAVASLKARQPHPDDYFWDLAAFLDENGAHKLGLWVEPSGVERRAIEDKIYAWWAWSEKNKFYAPRDGSVADCTEFVTKAANIIGDILLCEESPLIEAGRKFQLNETNLNIGSLKDVAKAGGKTILLRSGNSFVNHLYNYDDDGVEVIADIIVGYSRKTKAITLSVANPIEGFSCCKYMQKVYGDLAGGHDGIAGTPRDEEFDFEDAFHLFNLVSNDLLRKESGCEHGYQKDDCGSCCCEHSDGDDGDLFNRLLPYLMPEIRRGPADTEWVSVMKEVCAKAGVPRCEHTDRYNDGEETVCTRCYDTGFCVLDI